MQKEFLFYMTFLESRCSLATRRTQSQDVLLMLFVYNYTDTYY